jgi:uncharacterized protein (DUF952 family)
VLVHIIDRAAWERGDPVQPGEEGFVHLSAPEQVLTPANTFYRGVTGLVLLVVDPAPLGPALRWEPGTGTDEPFPHLYGTLPRAAVRSVVDFPCGSDGTFEVPALDP